MNESAGSEPGSLGAQARALVRAARSGTLATLSHKQPGFPFASLAPYSADRLGRPVFLFSRLAVHTHNLGADPRAALLVAAGNGLGDARCTLLGPVAPVPEDEREDASRLYLTGHDDARQWAGFGDFGFFRMEVREVYFVAGFGAMGWIPGAQYGGEQ